MSSFAQTLIVGVDGGGTGCRAAIGTINNGVLARAEGGPANATSDLKLTIENVINTVNCAAAKAGIATEALVHANAHLGLAGVMTPDDSADIAAMLPYGDVTVTDDRPTALYGALGGRDGYIVSVGTGAFAAASVDGVFRSVGGWGLHLGDQASGAWLGRAGLQQVLLCYDGLAEFSALTHSLFAEFDDDPNQLVAFASAAQSHDFGALAPMIIKGASTADPWCQFIMTLGADYLTRSLGALGFAPGDRLCLTGGVGPHYAPYLPTEFLTGLKERHGSGLDGAFQLAKSRLMTTVGAER